MVFVPSPASRAHEKRGVAATAPGATTAGPAEGDGAKQKTRKARSPADAVTRSAPPTSRSPAPRAAASPPPPVAPPKSSSPRAIAAPAAKLAKALRSDDMQGVYRTFIGRSKTDQRAIIAAFDRSPDAASTYLGAISNDFAARLGRMPQSHAARVRAYLQNPSSQLEPQDELYLAMRGSGTYEAGIRQTLSRLHSREIPGVDARFRQRYGDDYEGGINGALASELSGTELYEAKMLMRGYDRVTQQQRVAIELYRDGKGQIGTDETALFKRLEQLGCKDLNGVCGAYRELIGRDLRGDLRAEMDSPLEDRRMKGALGGGLGDAWASSSPAAKSARIDYIVSTLWSAEAGESDMSEATRVLGGLVDATGKRGPTPSQIEARYTAIYGRSPIKLLDALKRRAEPEERALIDVVQRGGDIHNNPDIMAARLYAETVGKMGTDEGAVCDILTHMPKGLRPRVAAAFARLTEGMTLEQAIRSDMSDTPQWRTRALEHLMRGPLSVERLAYHVSREAGEPGELVSAVRSLSPEQRSAFAVNYRRINREPLEAALKRLPDRDERALRDLLAVEGGAAQVARMQERTSSEAKREVGSSLSATLMRRFGWSADFVDDAVVAFDHVVRVNLDAAHGRPLDQAQARAISSAYLTFVDRVRAYQGEKDEVGETAGDIAAAAAATIVTIASGGSAAPLVVAIGASSAAAAKVTAETAFKGRDYQFGSKEFFRDLAVGGIDGAVTVATAGLARGATGLRALAVETAAGSAGGAVSGGVREGSVEGVARGAAFGGLSALAVSSVVRGVRGVTAKSASGGELSGGSSTGQVAPDAVPPIVETPVTDVTPAEPQIEVTKTRDLPAASEPHHWLAPAHGSPGFERFSDAMTQLAARDAASAKAEIIALAKANGVHLGDSAEGIVVARGDGSVTKYSVSVLDGEPPMFVGDLALRHQAQALERLEAAGFRVTRPEGGVGVTKVSNVPVASLSAQRGAGIEAGDLVRGAAEKLGVPPKQIREFLSRHFVSRVERALSGDVCDVSPTRNFFFDGSLDDFARIYRGAPAEADAALRARAIVFDPVESSWHSDVFAAMLRQRGAVHPSSGR